VAGGAFPGWTDGGGEWLKKGLVGHFFFYYIKKNAYICIFKGYGIMMPYNSVSNKKRNYVA
jgi:hypothetical protein